VEAAIRASNTLIQRGHTGPDYEYDRFVKDKVFVEPGVRRVNAALKKHVEMVYPTTEVGQLKRIDDWIHQLWKKWVQVRLKALRRLRVVPNSITPNTTPSNTTQTSISIRQSTLSPMPIMFGPSLNPHESVRVAN
jgi:hypothetical protein